MIFSLPQTSLFPSIIEIISFIGKNWPDVWWYPDWYLGVPLRFITGPVVPLVTLIISKTASFNIGVSYGILIALSWLWGIVGFQKLLKALGVGKKIFRLSLFFYLLLPFNLFLFSFGNGLHHITSFLLPWPLYLYLRLLEGEGKAENDKKVRFMIFIATILSILILFLIDMGVLLPLVIGMCAVYASAKKSDQTLVAIVRSIALLACAFSLSMIWYSPGYYWTVLANPSFGGRPLSNVIPMLLQLVQALVPVVIGVWVAQKRVIISNRLIYFASLFGASFLLLTVIRMASDIDFWMDWSSYGLELQFAGAILLATGICRYNKKQIVVFISICILTIIDGLLLITLYTNSKDKTFSNEISDITKPHLEKDARWFLSGSPVFWLGAAQYQSIRQVRGGKDAVAIHPTWNMGAYQIREGKNAALTSAWLEALGVSYVLVHTDNSTEYFHDFTQVEKFDVFEKAATSDIDRLYTTGFGIVRTAESQILEIDPPTNGEDQNVARYSGLLDGSVQTTWPSPSMISIEAHSLRQGQLIWLAQTYDKNWQLLSGKGRLKRDSFGNTILIPQEGSTSWQLRYTEGRESMGWGLLLFLAFGLMLVYSNQLTLLVSRRIPSLGVEDVDEHDNY